MPTSGPDRRRCRGLLALAALLGVLGSSLTGVAAPAGTPEAVEDLLWDLHLVPLEGEPPAFRLPGLDGKSHSLADERGRVAFLYFWATW